MPKKPAKLDGKALRTAGIFSGVGGLELGLSRHGHSALLLVENEPTAQAVLRKRFPGVRIAGDVRNVQKLPECDLVTAGFPCQDLSQCGKTAGVDGAASSLVNEVFRLIDAAKQKPNWVLLENVPFMLCLDSGRAMRLITSELIRLGYRWAYRTVNAKAFGVPQRRLRVVVLASRDGDPRDVIFSDNEPEPQDDRSPEGFGFYWTEGATGLGWARNCVPTLKGGSTLGIPSPPAIWIPHERRLATIDIRDAERLQGFPVNWTRAATNETRRAGARWRLVGNAVCVHVASWVGRRLVEPDRMRCKYGASIGPRSRWPSAAYGDHSGAREVIASTWPVVRQQTPIVKYLRFPLRPLSVRATAGFLQRARQSSLRFEEGFLADVAHHLKSVAAMAGATY